jgi:hypothetical protein
MDILRILAALSIPFLLLVILITIIVFQQRQRRKMGSLLLKVPLLRSQQVTFVIVGILMFVLGFTIVPLIWTRVNGSTSNLLWDFVRGLIWGLGITFALYGIS